MHKLSSVHVGTNLIAVILLLASCSIAISFASQSDNETESVEVNETDIVQEVPIKSFGKLWLEEIREFSKPNKLIRRVYGQCYFTDEIKDAMFMKPAFVLIRDDAEIRVGQDVTIEQLRGHNYDPFKRRTTILIHGFTQSYPGSDWLHDIKALYLQHSHLDHQNLVIMDWSASSQLFYTDAAAMVGLMGEHLADFIKKLLEMGTERNSIHLIAHSLGAHLAGIAGKAIRPPIGRITALDPAGPCFGKIYQRSEDERLTASDAYEVDVYHYDDGFLGLPGQHGTHDVYVNGGVRQPGCPRHLLANLFRVATSALFKPDEPWAPSHRRSIDVASIPLSGTGCQQVAYECRNYYLYTRGECGQCDDDNNQCLLLGFDYQYSETEEVPLRAPSPGGKKLYISTGSNSFFCQNQYQVLVKFEPSPKLDFIHKKGWRLKLKLTNELGESTEVRMKHQMAPGVFTYLLKAKIDRPVKFTGARLQLGRLGRIIELTGSDKSRPMQGISVEINFMSNYNPEFRRSFSSSFIPYGWIPISRDPVDFIIRLFGHKPLIGGWVQLGQEADLKELSKMGCKIGAPCRGQRKSKESQKMWAKRGSPKG